jgi:hypothetical protein
MTKKKRPQRKKNVAIHPMTKVYTGFKPSTPDVIVREYFEKVFPTKIEKPCGILEWCPYGPLVEEFPLDGNMHGDIEFRRKSLAEPSACRVFGHDCPVFYVAEPFFDPDAVADNCLCDECLAKREAEATGPQTAGDGESTEEPDNA